MLAIQLQQPRVYQAATQAGRQETGRSLQQLNQKFNGLPDRRLAQISGLNLEQIEASALAILQFFNVAELEHWLNQQQ